MNGLNFVNLVVDRIFSRVGASDDLSANQSTFMVEMAETSTILSEATSRSFVIMDEIGRGTSTLDGLSLAYAILHHLHSVNKCRGIFATHYHELAKMISDPSQDHKSLFERVACYQTAVASDDEGHVTCLYQVRKGIMDCSHGIQVAQKAGNSEI
jgi:DNA mismatch repair protein MutS